MLNEKKIQRNIVHTDDGTTSLYVPELNEHYHSIHGALVESNHVYIEAGLRVVTMNPCMLLEAGFGTGLNAILTLIEATEKQRQVIYHTYEKYPLSKAEYALLNFADYLPDVYRDDFEALHTVSWNETIKINDFFSIYKYHADFQDMRMEQQFNLIYYDAFNPDVQPHLWSKELLGQFYKALKPGGVLTTYCVKGIVKQALRANGFMLKRLPGPPGKRQMLRATKPME